MPSRHNRGPSTAYRSTPPPLGAPAREPAPAPPPNESDEEQSHPETETRRRPPDSRRPATRRSRSGKRRRTTRSALDTTLSHRSLGVGHQTEAHADASDDDRHQNQQTWFGSIACQETETPWTAETCSGSLVFPIDDMAPISRFRSPRRPAMLPQTKSMSVVLAQYFAQTGQTPRPRWDPRYPPWPRTTRYASSTRQVSREREAREYRVDRYSAT